jgi:hypothetical protein
MFIRFRVLALAVYAASGFILAACGQTAAATPTEPEDPLETSVTATLTVAAPEAGPVATATEPPTEAPVIEPTATPPASPTPTDTPTAAPTPLANNVSGAICFPSESIPAMNAYFEETETEALVELPIAAGQTSFEVKLAPGTYIAYAWLTDFSRGGLYSRAVPCGLNEECDDHTLLPFTASESELLTGIDLCDWYAGPFNVPYPPGKEQAELTGDISGNLTYIEEEIPGLRVVAFNLNTNYWYWTSTQEGQTFYTIAGLPPGTYHVVAYDAEGRAGGHAGGNHNLIDVPVQSGETTSGVDINDWDAPEGSFPEDPTR